MFGLGMGELIVIFFVVFLLFGPKALPEIAKGLGQAFRMFKQETNKINDEINKMEDLKNVSPDASLKNVSAKNTSNDFDPQAPKRDWRPKSTESKTV